MLNSTFREQNVRTGEECANLNINLLPSVITQMSPSKEHVWNSIRDSNTMSSLCYIQLVCILIVRKYGFEHIIIIYSLHNCWLACPDVSTDLRENGQYVLSCAIWKMTIALKSWKFVVMRSNPCCMRTECKISVSYMSMCMLIVRACVYVTSYIYYINGGRSCVPVLWDYPKHFF